MATRIILFLLLFSTTAFADEFDLYSFSTPQDASRYQTLVKEIRCVVCQGQNIADSNAPLATDLRNKVYLMVKEQKSDEQIKDYLVKRYGEFILYKPIMNKLTFVLWGFPFAAVTVLFALLGFSLSSRASRRR